MLSGALLFSISDRSSESKQYSGEWNAKKLLCSVSQ